MTETLRVATRGSQLALRQATIVAEALERRRYEVEIVTVETTGDQLSDELIHRLGKTGAFVRNLDDQVLEGDVDMAVHSMKDMPTDMPSELVVAAIPPRASPADVLITPEESTLESLPADATIGTASLRRGALLHAERPDVQIEPIRGNVDTRLEKLYAPSVQAAYERVQAQADDDEEDAEAAVEAWLADRTDIERRALDRDVTVEYDGLVLAEAGIERLGIKDDISAVRLEPSFVPAPGQGAIAVTALDGDTAESVHGIVDHPPTRVETTVERTILSTLGGGCIAPIGINATLQGEHVRTRVRVLSQDGTEEISTTRDLPVEQHPDAAKTLAESLASEGADDLIQRARRDVQ